MNKTKDWNNALHKVMKLLEEETKEITQSIERLSISETTSTKKLKEQRVSNLLLLTELKESVVELMK